MKKLTPLLLLASVMIFLGCDGGGGGDSKPSGGGSGGGGPATTQSAQSSIPQVGKPHATAEQYKPVVGAYGGRLIRGNISEPKSFNPIVMSETSSSDYTMRMFEGLTRENSFTGELEPGIAESWSVTDDGLTWTFKLRKDVKFNDGTPFTAEDVEFTWEDLVFDANRPKDKADARWPCSMRDLTTFSGKRIEVKATDPYTVVFKTPFKFAILPALVGNQILSSKKKYAPMVADGSFGGSMGTDAKSSDIVSTGPWMLGSYSRGERVVLKRNPHYWRKDAAGQAMPYLDEIVFLLAKNFDTQFLQFDQGEIDHYHCYRGGKDVAALRPKQQQNNFTLHQLGPDAGDVFMMFNMNLDAAKKGKIPEYKAQWFRDQRFRQAVSYAIDREAIVRNIYRNLAYPQYATESIGAGPFTTHVDPIPRSVDKAKALLADMGLTDRNGDGIIEDAQGRKVQFTIFTNAGNTAREEMCTYLATDLRKIGMEVNSLFLEFNQLIDRMDVSHDWEAMVMAFTSMWDPHWGSNFWKSDSRNHIWWPEQKQPGFPWEKRIDEIFEQAIQELDKEKRKAMYAEVTRISYEQQPVVFLAVRERVDAIRNKFGNVFPSPAPLWAHAALHNEDEMFLLENAGKAPKAPVAAAAASAAAAAEDAR